MEFFHLPWCGADTPFAYELPAPTMFYTSANKFPSLRTLLHKSACSSPLPYSSLPVPRLLLLLRSSRTCGVRLEYLQNQYASLSLFSLASAPRVHHHVRPFRRYRLLRADGVTGRRRRLVPKYMAAGMSPFSRMGVLWIYRLQR
jgi:hypothetical protein